MSKKGIRAMCGCGATVWWKLVRGEMRPYEVDGWGHLGRIHICAGGKGIAMREDMEDLYAACPWLKERGGDEV